MSDQYKIPQNIDVEDKVFGPFTLRQFLYMLGGGILTYFLFLTIGSSSFSLFLLVSLPVAGASLALVFAKINGRDFLDFFFYFLAYMSKPKINIWEKSVRIKSIMAQSVEESRESVQDLARRKSRGVVGRSRLAQLATIIDTQGWNVGEILEQKEVASRVSNFGIEPVEIKAVKEKDALEDVFADLEEAMDDLTSSQANNDFKDLAAGLSNLLSNK